MAVILRAAMQAGLKSIIKNQWNSCFPAVAQRVSRTYAVFES